MKKTEELAYLKLQLERARTQTGYEGWACPLCVYEEGVFIEHCSLHREIEKLTWQLLTVLEDLKEMGELHWQYSKPWYNEPPDMEMVLEDLDERWEKEYNDDSR